MPQRSHKIIVVLFSLIPFSSAEAQNIFQQPNSAQQLIPRSKNLPRVWMYQISPQDVKNATLYADPYLHTHKRIKPVSWFMLPQLSQGIRYTGLIPRDFYSLHMGYFCKKELQLDKISPLPLRFRLGSREYVDFLENKPNSIWPQQ